MDKIAKKYLVGGVNSPVRSFKEVGGRPVFIKNGKAAYIFSCAAKKYIDYCLSWGALILGHSHPRVNAAAKAAIDSGSSFGCATPKETKLAQLICRAIPAIEKIRLTNSGTEAVMGALRLARAFTNKRKIIKFKGCYHGHADHLLDSAGIPADFTKHTLVCPYNDIKAFESLVSKYKADLAAVIVEPVAGNMGVVLPACRTGRPVDGFLEKLRVITAREKIVLVFDEVITGFRFTYGGAQKIFKIKPDLTCLGKIIGGGFPIGAFGGKKEIMRLLAPEGKVYQAGTFSGNPVSVSAGIAALEILSQSDYEKLGRLACGLSLGIAQTARKYGISVSVNHLGAMFTIFFAKAEVSDYRTACLQDKKMFSKFYHGLLAQGIYLSPSGLEANFLSFAHTPKDIAYTLKAMDKVLQKISHA